IVARFVAPGGVLVITCVDAISHFAEIVRRFSAQLLIDPNDALADRAKQLAPVFRPHLEALSGKMTRPLDDWVIDNLLNPATIGEYLSIPDALAALAPEYAFYGSSPKFVTDWRWYKSIDGASSSYSERATEEYWRHAHCLLDHRRLFAPRPAEANRRL